MGSFATITQIAKELNVAPSTVSRALAGNPRISDNTRNRVLEVAETLGYRTNNLSRHLKEGKSRLIGLIVPDIALHFYATVVESIQAELDGSEYSLVLFNTFEQVEKEKDAIQKLLDLRVDGVLAAISGTTTSTDHFQELLKVQVPVVFYDRVDNFMPVPKVISDDYRASYTAVKYLIDSGCRKIAHITASKAMNNSNNRLYGYLDALREAGLPVEDELVFYSELDHQKVEEQLAIWLDQWNLDGIFVFNDYLANAAANNLLQRGIKIPEEISIMGFSDEPVASYMTPQLSTVEGVAPRMGKLATQKLMAIVSGKEPLSAQKQIVPQKIILRGTTK